MKNLCWRKDVYEELEGAANFYRERNVTVMTRFIKEFERTLYQIQQNPKQGAKCGDDARRRRMFGFPFDIVYLEHHEVIVLVALAHHSRRPNYWKSRLQ